MATNYARGRGLEYRARKALEAAGYCVIRAAQSKGVADLWAASHGKELLFVSCKLGNGGCGPAERKALYTATLKAGALGVVCWQRKPRGPMRWLVVNELNSYEPEEWQP